jgi:creatinine amidohydrolase/Fe(II)-dependent formamide hydrolase-like protein
MIRVTDIFRDADEIFPTLHDAMTALLERYPEAVFSDHEWPRREPIWVWPTNTASMHADPAQASAWIHAPEED